MNTLLNNLSLNTKIIGNAVILLLLFALSAVYAMFAMNEIGKELTTVATRDIPLTEHVGAITANQLKQSIEFERAIRFAPTRGNGTESQSQFRQAIRGFDHGTVLIEDEIAAAEKLATSVSQETAISVRQKFEAIFLTLERVRKEHIEFVTHVHEVFDALQNGGAEVARSDLRDIENQTDRINQELNNLLNEIGRFTEASAITAVAHEQNALTTLIISVSFSMVFGLLVSWYISRSIVRGVKRAIVTASGDLTQEINVDSNDEIGELLGAMNGLRQKLLNMVSQISGTTAQLTAASEEMAVVTEQSSQTIEQQRSETEQVATAMNEMSVTAQEIAENINQTASAVNETSEHANQGSHIVHQTIGQIQRLSDEVELSAKAIGEVDEYSEKISGILVVIRSIAEQTNLLALNAAIEAARAGDQGRGFAVVADEVRALASRTQGSTDEINEMISKLQSVSAQAVKSMTNNRSQVNATVDFAGQAGQALQAIDQAMTNISGMAIQIASASEEQVGVADEINANIVRINSMANQTAEGAEETATASRDLTRMANDLQGLVAQFSV